MNPNFPSLNPASRPAGAPRLVCRLVRHWSALRGADSPRHAASCPDCQAYFNALDTLDRGLRHDAVARSAETAGSDALERDILRAVRQSAARPTERRSPRGAGWMLAGLATAASIALAMVFFERASQSGESIARSDPMSSQAEAQAIVNAVETFSDRLVGSVIPSAGELVARNPMQQEMGSVYSDMRSALDFLALNFLPTSAATTPTRSNG